MLPALNVARDSENTLSEEKTILQCVIQWSQYSETKDSVVIFSRYRIFLAPVFSVKTSPQG